MNITKMKTEDLDKLYSSIWEELGKRDYVKQMIINNVEHKQVKITVNDKTYEIDEKLAPLIKEMLAVGIKTEYSCEATCDGAYISMDIDCFNLVEFRNKDNKKSLVLRWDIK